MTSPLPSEQVTLFHLFPAQTSYLNNYIGSFGRVRLAKNKKSGEYYAMKILKKADIIKLKQVDHVISENTILADIDHPYLV